MRQLARNARKRLRGARFREPTIHARNGKNVNRYRLSIFPRLERAKKSRMCQLVRKARKGSRDGRFRKPTIHARNRKNVNRYRLSIFALPERVKKSRMRQVVGKARKRLSGVDYGSDYLLPLAKEAKPVRADLWRATEKADKKECEILR